MLTREISAKKDVKIHGITKEQEFYTVSNVKTTNEIKSENILNLQRRTVCCHFLFITQNLYPPHCKAFIKLV